MSMITRTATRQVTPLRMGGSLPALIRASDGCGSSTTALATTLRVPGRGNADHA